MRQKTDRRPPLEWPLLLLFGGIVPCHVLCSVSLSDEQEKVKKCREEINNKYLFRSAKASAQFRRLLESCFCPSSPSSSKHTQTHRHIRMCTWEAIPSRRCIGSANGIQRPIIPNCTRGGFLGLIQAQRHVMSFFGATDPSTTYMHSHIILTAAAAAAAVPVAAGNIIIGIVAKDVQGGQI